MITKFTEVERAEICDLANETLLKETTEDTLEALKYLTDVRGISLEVLKKFRFGYIPKRVGHDWSERIIMPLYDSHDNLIVLTSRKFRTTDHKQRPHLHEQFDKKRFFKINHQDTIVANSEFGKRLSKVETRSYEIVFHSLYTFFVISVRYLLSREQRRL